VTPLTEAIPPNLGDRHEARNCVLLYSRVFFRPRLRGGYPSLAEAGTATQLIVDGKPFLVLAGELHNSSATSLEYMKPVWARLAEAKLNTVLAGVSWNQIEPQEASSTSAQWTA